MIGLSTVWTSRAARSGDDLLGPILDLGFAAVELEYRITEQIYQEILPRIRANEIQVLSIHNYFPVPAILPPERASGDCFSLSSLDSEERAKGVFYTSRTIEHAHDLGARAVVLHLGRVETDLPRNGLQQLYREGAWNKEDVELLQREREARAQKRGPHLDALLFSLDRILKRAEQLGVILGIENRYYFQEMPDKEEIGIILDQFRGAPIGYWHDTGHAAVFETLGILKHEELLQRYAPHLVGTHLHDALKLDDHNPPGKGEISFEMIKKYIPEGAIKIMEIHPQAQGQEVLDGLVFLQEKGIGT
ncbi:MAG: sugar phosphate isomerase/epimerase [Deltaproteobacteria bacterium]|nr:sugar phosphate isomerase/epimerase [Deltaproteobacteria bacterium]